MSNVKKLEEVSERKEQLEQELKDIASVKENSTNPALGEMETVLMKELAEIEQRIHKIKKYLGDQEQQPQTQSEK